MHRLTDWLRTYESVAIWLEGIALVLIFVWDRLDSRKEHKETLAQLSISQKEVESLVHAERAWVFGEMKKIGQESFSLQFTNQGKTPAEVIDVKQRETWTDLTGTDPKNLELPVPPDYGLATKFIQPRIIVPGHWFVYDHTNLTEALPGEIVEEIRKSRKRYFIYGRVQYRDLIDRTKIRETGFCYFWSPLLDEFVIGGPEEYTYYT